MDARATSAVSQLKRLATARLRGAEARVAAAQAAVIRTQQAVRDATARLEILTNEIAVERRQRLREAVETPVSASSLARISFLHRIGQEDIEAQLAAIEAAKDTVSVARDRLETERAAMARHLRNEQKLLVAEKRLLTKQDAFDDLRDEMEAENAL